MDREKVVKGLNDIGGFIAGRIGIEQARNFLRTIDDAIALLKEQQKTINALESDLKETLEELADKEKAQEPISPSCDMDGRYLVCGNCGKKIGKSTNYCTKCGRAVKWE